MEFPMNRKSTEYLNKMAELEERDKLILNKIIAQIAKLRQLDVDSFELTRSTKHRAVLGDKVDKYIQYAFKEEDKIAKVILVELKNLLHNYHLQLKMLKHLEADVKKNPELYKGGKRAKGGAYQAPELWIHEK